ncbi:hypothetical protein RJ640_013257 [Escallonia rubra]|uniref:SHSP domain-containing protein n=1 Tax=Escallonia rubra TaxID=112253 RepID=A0AA88QZ70_9ASTE|nr:hypothetical protein RJ640_013257 [Escallonia rubra]
MTAECANDPNFMEDWTALRAEIFGHPLIAEHLKETAAWKVTVDKHNAYLKRESLPAGIGIGDVKLSVRNLVDFLYLDVKGESPTSEECLEATFYVQHGQFRLDEMKAEMLGGGVLQVVVPKAVKKVSLPYKCLAWGLPPLVNTCGNPFLRKGDANTLDMKEEDDGFRLRLDMPGVGRDAVKVWVENEMLFVKGIDITETARFYNGGVLLNPSDDKPLELDLDQIEVEIKNGVLKVFIPKKLNVLLAFAAALESLKGFVWPIHTGTVTMEDGSRMSADVANDPEFMKAWPALKAEMFSHPIVAQHLKEKAAWEVTQDQDNAYLKRQILPAGIAIGDVKLSARDLVDYVYLDVKAENPTSAEALLEATFYLKVGEFRLDAMKAEMLDGGVLQVVVPKAVKEVSLPYKCFALGLHPSC